MDRISRCSKVVEGFHFGGLTISLTFTDYVVLLVTSSDDLQLELEWFIAKCEVVEMRISASKFKVKVLSWKSAPKCC